MSLDCSVLSRQVEREREWTWALEGTGKQGLLGQVNVLHGTPLVIQVQVFLLRFPELSVVTEGQDI